MIANRSTGQHRRRSGFGLVELALTGFLITAGMVATLQVVGWVAGDRRAAERRERAVVEAANLMERIHARPWDELTTANLASTSLARPTKSFLPGARLNVEVAGLDDPPRRKKITVEIRWNDRSGRAEAPVRLVAWSYPEEEGSR